MGKFFSFFESLLFLLAKQEKIVYNTVKENTKKQKTAIQLKVAEKGKK
jgi:hypothetical protein